MSEQLERLLLRARDAAKLLSISERTVWQLTHEGKLASVRFGRTVRYDVHDLQAFIAAQRQTGGQPASISAREV